jgi:protein TonB
MRGLSGFTMIMAAAGSTIIHFFVLTLIDTIRLVPNEITTRLNTIEVELSALSMESAVPPEEEKAVLKPEKEIQKEVQKEVKKEVKQETPKVKVALADRGKEKKEPSQVADEEQRLAAKIKAMEQKVAGRTTDASAVVTDAEVDAYYAMVEERVKRGWVIPDSISEKGLKAVIIIEINKKGEVVKTSFEQPSGNPSFDQAAMWAISKAAPFSPPPGQVPLKIGLIFQPR